MAYAALRRTKRVTDIQLVGKEVQIRRVDWVDGPHKKAYDALFFTARAIFQASLDPDGSGNEIPPKQLFELLFRVRQACCHMILVPPERIQRAEFAFMSLMAENRQLSFQEAQTMTDMLLGKQANEIVAAKSFSAPVAPSPKIVALFAALEEMKTDEKGIIFSQWPSFLNLIEQEAESRGYKMVRIDGSKSTQERIEAMQQFKDSSEVRLILCSLKAAGTGIDLTPGNVVFLTDVWWNEAAEHQAMDRCHRVGQKRDVRCVRFVMKDSIEERMVCFQQSKAALGKGSLERLSPDEERRAKIGSLRDLFQLAEGDKIDDFVDWDY